MVPFGWGVDVKYLGGKSRIVARFSDIIERSLPRHGGRFYEPFVGGFSVVSRIRGIKSAVCVDIHPGVISLYRAMQGGWLPPNKVSEDTYQYLKEERDWSDPLTAFVAFGCSFGGKEWGGYARNNEGGNYALASKNSLVKAFKAAPRDLEFLCGDYEEHEPDEACVIYADPPYVGTTGYKTGEFDHTRFQVWCEDKTLEGSTVFVSEFTRPNRPGWNVVWDFVRKETVSLGVDEEDRERTEYLIKLSAPQVRVARATIDRLRRGAGDGFWYLASPYNRYTYGWEAAFKDVSRVAAYLTQCGVPVYSPITHMHPLAMHGNLNPVDYEIWTAANDPMIRAACGIVVCKMEGWGESTGINLEIEAFEWLGKPLLFMDYPSLFIGERRCIG